MSHFRDRQQWYRTVCGADVVDYDVGALQFIADGPLADPERAFCPAGRLTTAQMKAREASQVAEKKS